MTLLLWIGASAILPMLPSYLRRHGASPGLIGVVMAAYYAASVATQYPAGRISDRFGRRPVVLGGLVLFALGSVGFALTAGAGAAIVFRSLQGVGAGAVTVAAAATIGSEVPAGERGAAFGSLYGSQMLALAIGPLVGSLIGASSMGLLFVAASICAVVAALPVLPAIGAAPRPGPTAAIAPGSDRPPVWASAVGPSEALLTTDRPEGYFVRRVKGRAALFVTPALVGVVVVFAATGVLTGIYETTWTLLLRTRHASNFAIGLSWTLFALPFAAMSVPAGRLAERVDRRILVVAGLGSSGAFALLYPFLHSVALLVGLATLEAIGAVFASPASVLVLSESVPSERQGEAQGAVETARTAAAAFGAAVSGALFGISVVVPFAAMAAVMALASVIVVRAWRNVPGPGRAPGVGRAREAAAALSPGEP